MADPDTPSPEQNEDPAAEAAPAEPEDSPGAEDTSPDAAGATDDAPGDPPAEEAEAGEGASVAETLAAEALQAAQQAVSGLGSDDAEGDTDSDNASDDADAAMAAMMDAQAVPMPSLSHDAHAEVPKGIDLLADVNLDVTIELGRTRMYVEDVLKLSEGAVVELDKLAGDPVDIYVNNRLVARGEVLILNDNFCVRVNDIIQLQPEAAAG